MWNWRRGLIISVIVLACIIAIAATSNKYFVKKWQDAYSGVNDFISKDDDEIDRVRNKDRHWILAKAIPEIKKKPIAGHGIDINFKIAKSFLQREKARPFIHTHCEFTQFAIQFGLVGTGLFTIFLLCTFFYSAKIPLPLNRFALAAMLIIIIDMLFNVPLYFCRQKYMTMFTLAIVLSEISYYWQNKSNAVINDCAKSNQLSESDEK
jgi:O-antigen ligase